MLRKILAVDHAYARRIAVEQGHPHFPAAVREVVQGDDGVDLVESLIFIAKQVPASDSPEDVAAVSEQTERLSYALEMNGWRTVICPAKRSGDGYKQSDDARLVIESLALCLRLRPDFFVLFARRRRLCPAGLGPAGRGHPHRGRRLGREPRQRPAPRGVRRNRGGTVAPSTSR